MSIAPVPAQAQSNAPATPSSSLSDLISIGDVHDALATLSDAHEPYDLSTLLARAELLLMAGYDREAEAEFARSRQLTPTDESIADYGISLCDMMRGDLPAANSHLRRCLSGASYTAHQEEIDLAMASQSAAEGKSPGRPFPTATSQSSGLLSQELAAIQNISAGSPSPSDNSSPWMLPESVPRVSETFGLRADALIARCSNLDEPKLPIIAAPLRGSDAAAQIVSALLPRQFPGAGAPLAKTVSGTVILFPPSGSRVPAGVLASYVIDGNVAAVVNSNSLAYRWDTRGYQNGRHSVQVVLSTDDEHSGQLPFLRYYDVRNPQSAVPGASGNQLAEDAARNRVVLSPADQTAVDDAWQILALQPDYAIGERILAKSAQQSGNATAALYHSSCAEAISFDGNPEFLRRLSSKFANRLPVTFANTDRSLAHPEPTTTGLWRGNPSKREVALTFDDGPSPTLTPPLLDALRDAKVPATFFVVGARAQLAPDLILRMHSEGHEVEDHSYSHPNLDQATPQHVYEEILRNAVIVETLTGTWPHFLRPPGGQSNPRVLIEAAKCGMTGAFWTLDALSAEDSGSPAAVTQFVLKRIKPGAVVLMHNGPYATTHAVADLASQLRARGYTLVTLLQLAHDASR